MATDILEILGTEYSGVTGIKATDSNNQIKIYIRPQGTKSIAENGTGIDVAEYATVNVSVSGGGSTLKFGVKTWTNSSTSTVSHQFTGLDGTPIAAILRCTSQLTRSSSNSYYYIADIVWDGTNCRGNYHLRSNGSYNNQANYSTSGYFVTTADKAITFSSSASSRSSAPGSFYNGTYELTYFYL